MISWGLYLETHPVASVVFWISILAVAVSMLLVAVSITYVVFKQVKK